MLPYKTLIILDRNSETPLFLQIANTIILNIKKGVIPTQTKLPGTRLLSETLNIHRKTVIAAYEELYVQGWIEQIPSKGTFVSNQIPEIKPQKLEKSKEEYSYASKTGYKVPKNIYIGYPVITGRKIPGFDDGFPDVRLAPIEVLGRKYRNILSRNFQQHLLSYSETKGRDYLREMLAVYLQKTRGLAVSTENIMVTKGSIMGIDLISRVLLKKGDKVMVGETNYFTANMAFQNTGAELLKIKVDENGINTEEIEKICRKKTVRLLYITPHHHYPTTVTLSAERRIKLLQLASEYGFAIIEDDYDYDFHYSSSPILPLASADHQGMVAYVGSFAKTIAPAIRVGYVVAPVNLIEELGYLRRITDRQGDNVLEQAVAEMLAEGEIQRHLKKTQKIYHNRRNIFCEIVKENFKDRIDFTIPDGGMAVWAKFNKNIHLSNLSEKALKKGLYINNGIYHNTTEHNLNSTRMGFASLNEEEIDKTLALLRKVMD